MAVLGAAAGGAFPQLCITKSQTWVPPMDGKICIHLVGAGGGGAGGTGNQGNKSGGAGGYCKKNSFDVTTSGSFTLVVGRGGFGGKANMYSDAHMVQYGIAGVPTLVRNGGSTTMAGTGLSSTLGAYGGSCGRYDIVNTGNSFHGGGGGASNGDVNFNGGGGASNGGGAVGVYAHGATSGGHIRSEGGGRSDAAGGGLELSGFGMIVGGPTAGTAVIGQTSNPGGTSNGTALNGGGFCYSSGDNGIGGNGGLGAGGGAGQHSSNSHAGHGGHGGHGFILIQYLPW